MFRVSKTIAFSLSFLRFVIGVKKFAPLSKPITRTRTNRNSFAQVFPRFLSATSISYEF